METRFVLKEKDLMGFGKKSLEWDLNDWKWDGDLFLASSLNSVPINSREFLPVRPEIPVTGGGSSNSSSSCSDEINLKGKKELEKRRRVVIVEDDDDLIDEAENLTLKLGEHVYPITEGDGGSGKKLKLLETTTATTTTTTNRAVCQVEDCGVDLSIAKPYHRRHKVCEMHSKASQSLVGNVLQRFCQQCSSRFHLLQEFDEGKRSCRRRLAGHNRRRRKPQREAVFNGSSLNDEEARGYLLITLLRILSNLHSNNSDQTKDEVILSHLLRNLASLADTFGEKNTSGLQQGSQDMLNAGTLAGTSLKIAETLLSIGSEPSKFLGSTSRINGGDGAQDVHMRPTNQSVNVVASKIPQVVTTTHGAWGGSLQTVSPNATTSLPMGDSVPAKAEVPDSTAGRIKLNDFDLNSIYIDSQDCIEGLKRSETPLNLVTNSLDCPSWVQQHSHQSSPPQTSGNSDSASDQSPSSSSGDAQSRTDRIVFKLFGKDPHDFPLVLRSQILDWLSHSPTDIESYIRPGCIMLTIYLRLTESMWEELHSDLSSSLSRLLDVSDDPFWRRGWVYARVQHRIAFIFQGQVVLDMPLPRKEHNDCKISSITPLALSVSESTQFIVKGFNLFRPTTRLLCALDGKYLVQEVVSDLVEGSDTFEEDDELQCLSFTCSVPDVTGRGFIEVDDNGLSSSSFPFIVAEQDVCSEICTLEGAIEASESDADDDGRTSGRMGAKDQALNFIHEMGWLLHRSSLRSKLGKMDPNTDAFTFTRFRGLMEFAMDHDWCAVVKKLLDILFEGTVDAGGHTSIELQLSEMGLLHRAVRRSCRLMVELLLRYVPDKASENVRPGQKQLADRGSDSFMFRSDDVGPADLTPLHIAASRIGSESVLDALTDDPGSVGVVAWKSALDKTGLTPEDYARMRGHYSYIHLVQKKINNKSEAGHVILDIPRTISESNNQKQKNELLDSAKVSGFQVEKKAELRPIRQSCKLCDQKLVYRNRRSFLGYRPTVLSLVSIAAVCVCLGLLFKSSPEVLCILSPFRWELLDFGTM
ncbi:Transcription factor [Macleaya cordata]|uniref:Transcription factor n=1 Tax=Macleaya cordata TaxID=56857 RepID=A0A200R1S4_MACCD|nr:Transcription factor [Macleaya cordata]